MRDGHARRPSTLLALGLLIEGGLLLQGFVAGSVPAVVAVQLALFVAYLWAARSACGGPQEGNDARAILGFALLFRLTLIVQPPCFSTDLYRYLWDGRVQVHGHVNPYRFAPADPALNILNDPIRSQVNHPDIPTLYPPVAESLFAAVAWAGGGVTAIKTVFALFDVAQILLLRRMLRRAGLGAARILIYAWSPLVISEVAGNGHLDVVASFFLVLGIHLIIEARPALSTLPLGLAAGVKLVPALAFPVLFRRIRPRFWILPFALFTLFTLPYLGAGRALLAGLRQYAERWQHNDFFFRFILAGWEALRPTETMKAGIQWLQGWTGESPLIALLYRYAYPVYLARASVALALLGASVWLAWRGAGVLEGSFALLALLILLSPTVHPWYLLWVSPFLVFFPSRAWILFSGLVALSYLDPGPVKEGVGGLSMMIWLEYVPFLAMLGWEALWRRRGHSALLFGLQPPGETKPAPAGR